MAQNLKGKKVAILIADGFEEVEMTKPREALKNAGAITYIISPVIPEKNKVRAWHNHEWSNSYNVDIHLEEAIASDYDALLLPGGVMNPDTLRLYSKAIDFIAKIGKAGKPIAAICHGPWTLIDAKLVKGKTVTSWPSLRVDLENAGAKWVDQKVVVDGQIVTSRKPDDIPAFNEALITLFGKK